MRYYKEDKIEKVNQVKAAFLTGSIYFLLFTGVFFATQPEKLPDVIKDWLQIEHIHKEQKEVKKLPKKQA